MGNDLHRQGHNDAEMARIMGSIAGAEGLGELLPLLELLSRETGHLLNDRTLDAHDIGRLAQPLAKIHALLAALDRPGSGPRGSEAHTAFLRELAEHFSELDGRVKELRNDLARAAKPRLP